MGTWWYLEWKEIIKKIQPWLFDTISLQNSLTKQPIAMDSPGRSGARMLMSRDKKFFIKSLVSEEVEMMHHLLKQYHQVSQAIIILESYLVSLYCKSIIYQVLRLMQFAINISLDYNSTEVMMQMIQYTLDNFTYAFHSC